MKNNDKLIAKFMGYQLVRIGYYGTDDETKWQVKYRDWLNKPEIVDQYDNSVGDYYVNIEGDLIIPCDDINYRSNWNDLMPVVEKIESTDEGFISRVTGCRIEGYLCDFVDQENTEVSLQFSQTSKIDAVYKAVVEFIKWHNTKHGN